MPPQTDAEQPQPSQGQSVHVTPAVIGDRVSRRSLLRGAAGAGAVGLAAAVGGAAFASANQSSSQPAAAPQATPGQVAGSDSATAPLVVYLRDTASGELEVFNGTSQTKIHNPGLAAQLAGLKTA
jgi:hypothetical protein